MICLTCKQTITKENRQTYQLGLRLPYCRTCVQAYIGSKKLRAMNHEQRTQFVRDTREKLKQGTYTQQEIDDARKQIKNMGLTDQEIDDIFKSTKNNQEK